MKYKPFDDDMADVRGRFNVVVLSQVPSHVKIYPFLMDLTLNMCEVILRIRGDSIEPPKLRGLIRSAD